MPTDVASARRPARRAPVDPPRRVHHAGQRREEQQRADQQREGLEAEQDVEHRVERDEQAADQPGPPPALEHRRRISRVEPRDRRRSEDIGRREADHFGEGEQEHEEQHQRRAHQQIFDRRDAHPADDVEHQQREEGEADEQEAVFGRPVDLRIEVDRLNQADLRGLRRAASSADGIAADRATAADALDDVRAPASPV